MKTKHVLPLLVGSLALGACSHHAIDELAEIAPSETAFLIALEGDTLNNQQRLQSLDFLEKNKVSAKRVLIPHKLINTCSSCLVGQYVDVPSARLIKISRAPVTREWTRPATTGTSTQNQAFAVESSESIDFDIGATITAHVSEEDAARFLYYFAGKQLSDVADSNIRGVIASDLSRQFGSNTLDWGRGHKAEVFAAALKNAREAFGPKGITIDNLGFVEGMTYHDVRIQEAINRKFEADMQVQAAQQQLTAAQTLAKAQDAVKAQQDLDLRRREMDLRSKALDKWDGHLPQVMGQDAHWLMGVPGVPGGKP